MTVTPMHRFPLVDRTGEFDECRDVIDHLAILEPHDDRSDECVSLPVRSVISATCGPAVEIGPFTLDTPEVAKLYNALASHVAAFPSEFHTINEGRGQA